MRALCILSGPPGAGKTTVAELLARQSERAVHFKSDDFWHYIASGYIAPWRPESKEQNEVVVEPVAVAAVRFCRGRYETIVDGVVGPWLLQPFVKAARPSGMAVDYVVLRPSLDIILARVMARAAPALKDEWPVRKMHGEFSELGEFERNVIESSAMTADETSTLVREGLSAGRFRVT